MRSATIRRVRRHVDLAGNVRAELGRAKISYSDLARDYGGAVSYWSRRANGLASMSEQDVEIVAEACGVHPAQLWGGAAPSGWLPRRDSNLEPSDYRTLFGARDRILGVAA